MKKPKQYIKITATENVRNLPQGFSVEFTSPVTIIVGSNGCGKSTILQAIRGKYDKRNESLLQSRFQDLSKSFEIESTFDDYFFLDAVSDSPDTINNAYDAFQFVKSGGFATKDLSHGQGQKYHIERTVMQIEKWRKENPNATALLILDEFDKGFDLKLQSKVFNILNNIALKHGICIICASHNYLLIEKSFVVFDFAEKCYEISEDYLNAIKLQ